MTKKAEKKHEWMSAGRLGACFVCGAPYLLGNDGKRYTRDAQGRAVRASAMPECPGKRPEASPGVASPPAKPLPGRALKAEERRQQALCDAWKYPEGTDVTVRKDVGEVVATRTRSMPWMVGGTAVILVEGIAGGYALERVRPVHP